MKTGGLGQVVVLIILLLTTTGCGGGGDAESCGIATAALPDGTVGVPYKAALTSDCGHGIWGIGNGELPPEIRLSDDGVLSGVPTLPGTYQFTVWDGEVSDLGFRSDKRDFTITI